MFDSNSAANKLASRIQSRLLSLASSETENTQQSKIAASPEGRRQQIEERLLDFEAISAVSGRFDPTSCFQPGEDPELRQAVLNGAVARHSVETVSGKVRWILNSDTRRTVLTRLSKNGNLHPLLAGALPDTDEYGEALRQLLDRGAEVSYASLSSVDLHHIKAAAEELAGTGLPLPEMEPIRRQMVTDAFRREYLPVLDHFVGRGQELGRLHEFLDQPRDPKRWPPWSALVITGLGGAGKSALLAQFVHQVYEQQKATIVVLDFDRPGIDPNDLVWLRLEIAKQVGLQYPEVDQQLRESRKEVRNVQVYSGERAYSDSFESVGILRSSDDLLYQVSFALQSAQALTKPFLLVFDTLELVSGINDQQALLKWIDVVGEILSTTPIKVIFSGRLFDSSVEEFRARANGAMTTLDVLPSNTAALLLRKSGVPARLAKALSRSNWLPRRPLELRLMARLALQGDLAGQTLERDLREGKKSELTAALIYRRVLLRIDDLLVRQLASPGLILRFVTPAILREVLVPALNLPDMTIDEAEQALDKLATHTWLVRRDSRGILWHRRDLRRSMLKLMVAEDPKIADQISQRAIMYFEESPNADPSEATYHRLMLMRQPEEGAEVELGKIKEAYDAISSDIDDLPPPAVALLRFAAQKNLTAEEMDLLPARYFRRAYEKTGRRLVRARQYTQAYRLLQRMRSEFPSDVGLSELTAWEADTLYATARWDELEGLDNLETRLQPRIKTFFLDVLLPGRTAPEYLSLDFDKALQEAAVGSGDFAGALRYFAVATVVLDQNGWLRTKLSAAIPRVLEVYDGVKNKPTSALLQHRLFLMRLLDDKPINDTLQLAPSLLELRPESLDRVTELSGAESLRELILTAAAAFHKGPKRRTVTTKNIMSAIDALYKHPDAWHQARVLNYGASDPRVLALLRGPDPEFRDPIRFCLLEEYADDAARFGLAELIQSVIDVPLDDLRPDAFAEQLALAPEHSLSAYVEFVDRSWRTGHFLKALCRDRPRSSRLEQVRAAHERWDDAINCMLASKFGNRYQTSKTMIVELGLNSTEERTTSIPDLRGSEYKQEYAGPEPTTPPGDFSSRNGYDSDFLDGWYIPLPNAERRHADDILSLRRGGTGVELKYRNFSVIMSKSRRLPMLTAANINGGESRWVPRIQTWSFDGRLDNTDQWGSVLYDTNKIDRGQIVRREAPIWGSLALAQEANRDTFHFTNTCPQIVGSNRRIWLGLEDYLLYNARANNMRVSVFTGPYFGEDDPIYRGARIPQAFWKVVAIVTDERRRSATAYELRQTLALQSVYAEYKTFQVSIQQVIERCGLDFSGLLEFDVCTQHERTAERPIAEQLDDFYQIRV